MADPNKLTIEITSGHCLGGEGNDVYPGHVMEAPRDLTVQAAQQKVRAGYARIITNATASGPEGGDAPRPEAIAPEVEHRDPQIESRDPQVAQPPKSRKRRPRAGGR